LTPGQFIHGQSGARRAALLRGRADIVTLLREPRDQVISNYLYVRRDRTSPITPHRERWDSAIWCGASPVCSFSDSLAACRIVERPVSRTEDYIDKGSGILAYLDERHLSGWSIQAGAFMTRLAESSNPIDVVFRAAHGRSTIPTCSEAV